MCVLFIYGCHPPVADGVTIPPEWVCSQALPRVSTVGRNFCRSGLSSHSSPHRPFFGEEMAVWGLLFSHPCSAAGYNCLLAGKRLKIGQVMGSA